ncbi:hypothetical protein BGX38DRAFT_1271617 [Terfezia claveryi]|nr:hypothetical protein BGX38DRAFT_1271617 [Terfezia claveryi]
MVQELRPVPNLGVLGVEVTNVSDNYRNLSQSYQALATQAGRIQNIPALNPGQQIPQELRRLSDRMELQFASMNHNLVARHLNSHAVLFTTRLTPLHNSQNQEVENFPANVAAIDALGENQLNQLLRAYDQPTIGNLNIRKRKFKRFIGIVFLQ